MASQRTDQRQGGTDPVQHRQQNEHAGDGRVQPLGLLPTHRESSPPVLRRAAIFDLNFQLLIGRYELFSALPHQRFHFTMQFAQLSFSLPLIPESCGELDYFLPMKWFLKI